MSKSKEITNKLQEIAGKRRFAVEALKAKSEKMKARAEELEKKSWSIERSVKEDEQKFLDTISIEDAIGCISNNRPEVIQVWEKEKNGRFIIVRPYGIEEYGILFYKDHKNSTQWQVSFNCDGFVSGHYSVPCACCHIELHKYKKPLWSKEEIEEWSKPLRAQLREAIIATCEKNGITNLFMRHAESWTKRFEAESIKAIELDRYQKIICEQFDEYVLSKSFGFINEITERD